MNLLQIKRNEPKRFFVLWRDGKGKLHQYDSNNIDVLEKKAALKDGTIYEDTRYKARHRLYWYLIRKQLYA